MRGAETVWADHTRMGDWARRHIPLVHFTLDSALWVGAIPLGVVLRYDFDPDWFWQPAVGLAVVVAVLLQGLFGWCYGLYRRRWRYGTFDEVRVVALTALSVGAVMMAALWWENGDSVNPAVPRSVPILATGICLLGQIAARSMWRLYVEHRTRPLHLSSPDVGPAEREALLRAFDSGWVAPVGPELDGFEDDLAAVSGWDGVVALSSGTAALHLALVVLGVGPGDEVLMSSFTFAATANAVRYTGATPVFIDSDSATWNMSPTLLAEELDERARSGRLPAAVVVVDLYGQCADYDEIVPLCAAHGVPLVEDAAEALLSTYKGRPAGTLGASGIYSFNGNKIMTTSGGGAFLSPSSEVADRVRYLATQARQPAVHYEHVDIGYNYRLSNLLAAIGRVQLARLPEMSARRRRINDFYRDRLGDVRGLSMMPIAPWDGWNGWLTCVVFDDPVVRERVKAALADVQIESRPLWKPMHLQPVFDGASARVDGTSERLFRHGLCVPSGSVLTDADVERVASIVADACHR